MKTSNYLDEAKSKLKISSDNELARQLEWSKSQVNNYRHNRQGMDNNAARKIAEILDIPVWKVIADMELIRAKDEPTRKAWKMLAKLSKQSGRATANLLITLPFLAYGALHYILCKIDDTRTNHWQGVSIYP